MTLDAAQRATLLRVAKGAIDHGLRHRAAPDLAKADYDSALLDIRSCFVTLEIEGRLRGCIGGLEATRPLVEDVAQHAHAAAFMDPRFSPVQEDELPRIDIHISILSPNTTMAFTSESDLIAQLRPGIDGLVIALGSKRATFLPSVWDSLPNAHQFLAHLKQKAGIAREESVEKAWRYMTESFGAPARGV